MMKSTAMIQLITVLGLLVLWELVGRSGLFISEVFPSFSEVLVQLGSILVSGNLGLHAGTTIYEVVIGFLFGGVFGLLIGGVMGASDYIYRVLEPLFYYFSAVPKIILFPVLLLFLGTGVESKMGMGAVSAFFPIVVNTALSVREVKPIYVRTARTLGASRWQIYTKVYVPSMLGPILAGMRLGLGVAITGTLLAETIVSRAGLGSQAVYYYSQLRIAEMYALLLLIFVGAYLINVLVSRLIRKATHYQNNNDQNIHI